MSVSITNEHIRVEFSLSLPKPSWKIRTKIRRDRRGNWVDIIKCYVFTPRIGDVIMKDDKFEWMITNEELRDVISALKCLSKEEYDIIKEAVYEVEASDYIDWSRGKIFIKEFVYGITVEASLRPKMRKPEELTPYLFIILPLDKASEAHYIIDKRGTRVLQPCGRRIMAGDKLIWVILDNDWIKDIALLIAMLSNDHNRRIKREVFDVIERLKPGHTLYTP